MKPINNITVHLPPDTNLNANAFQNSVNLFNDENKPDELGRCKYLVSCNTENLIIDVFHDLTINGRGEGVLQESILCTDYMYDSAHSCIFLLTTEQVDQLKKDKRVTHIIKLPLPKATTCYSQTVCAARVPDQGSVYDNWGLVRCTVLSSTNLPNVFNYTYTGSGVDIIMVDSGAYPAHPEFRDNNGNSRVQKIDWTLFNSVTSNTSQTVTVTNNQIYLNGQKTPDVLTWNNFAKKAGFSNYYLLTGADNNYPLVYNFNINNLNGTGKVFVISNTPYGPIYNGSHEAYGTCITNNGGQTGTVTLTANYRPFYYNPSNINLPYVNGVLYYYLSATSGPVLSSGGLIVPTEYNTLNKYYYTADGGTGSYFGYHGVHTTGIAAGSSFGFGRGANIYNMVSIDYGTFWGTANDYYGLDLILAFAKWKKTQPALSARPTVCSNSWRVADYGGCNYPDRMNGPAEYFSPTFYPQIEYVNSVVKALIDEGVIFVRAMGNEGTIHVLSGHPLFNTCYIPGSKLYYNTPQYSYRTGTPGWPAVEPSDSVIYVGATDSQIYFPSFESKSWYSSKGPAVTIWAPGTDIQSAFPSPSSYGAPLYKNGAFGDYTVYKISGTSMACPMVAGLIATILEQYPKATPQEIKNFIQANAIQNTLYDQVPANPSPANPPQFALSGSPNFHLYQFPGKQYYFKDLHDRSTINLGSLNFKLSGIYSPNTPILSGSSYTSFTHTFSALSAAIIEIS